MASKKPSVSKRASGRSVKVPTNCPFCKGALEPDYKDPKALEKYLTDRAKIVGRRHSGLCSKHQRRLSAEVKRARHLGLLPFTPQL